MSDTDLESRLAAYRDDVITALVTSQPPDASPARRQQAARLLGLVYFREEKTCQIVQDAFADGKSAEDTAGLLLELEPDLPRL